MGSIRKKTATKTVPAGAECFTRGGVRFARWKTSAGKSKTAKLTIGNDGVERIIIESGVWLGKYRNADGHIVEQSTACRDKQAAAAVVAQWERRVELVRAGVISKSEDRVAIHASTPLSEHRHNWLASMRASGRSARHIENAERLTLRACDECGFNTLRDIESSRFENWLATKLDEGMSARTRNSYLQALSALCEWCVKNGRLTFNPLKTINKADENADRRRVRRAMTEDELHRLLYAARWRPLAEQGREDIELALDDLDEAVERARSRLVDHPEFVAKLEHRGRERELLYKVMLSTGLRKNEIASVRLRDLDLDGERPALQLEARHEKNREGNCIPLRRDVAIDLKNWLAERAQQRQQATSKAVTLKFEKARKSKSVDLAPTNALKPDEFLFHVPTQLVRIFDADLKAAGIAKRDDRGRTLDVHALRTTFGTHLSKAGVSLRTAQAAMRHSTPTLTANIYTDPRLLDVQGAIEALPTLSLTTTRKDAPEVMKATGTFGALDSRFPPQFPPTSDKPCLSMACIGTDIEQMSQDNTEGTSFEKSLKTSENPMFSEQLREGGLEPPRLATPDPKSGASANFATPASEASFS